MAKEATNFNDNISISDFCDIQGIQEADKFVLLKKYNNIGSKSYDEWYDLAEIDFPLSDKKVFNVEKSEEDNKQIKK